MLADRDIDILNVKRGGWSQEEKMTMTLTEVDKEKKQATEKGTRNGQESYHMFKHLVIRDEQYTKPCHMLLGYG